MKRGLSISTNEQPQSNAIPNDFDICTQFTVPIANISAVVSRVHEIKYSETLRILCAKGVFSILNRLDLRYIYSTCSF